MRTNIVTITVLALLAAPVLYACEQPPQKPDTPPTIISEIDKNCVPNKFDYLRLDAETFDQDRDKGWRKVAQTDGCKLSAAVLINEYRTVIIAEHLSGLTWHEAQLRASMGETKQAIYLFKQTHIVKEPILTNIHYRDATIAFLEQDKPALLIAREKLSLIPAHQDFAASVEQFKKAYPDAPAPTWPPNLNIMDSFITCFDKPYKEAYSTKCGH